MTLLLLGGATVNQSLLDIAFGDLRRQLAYNGVWCVADIIAEWPDRPDNHAPKWTQAPREHTRVPAQNYLSLGRR